MDTTILQEQIQTIQDQITEKEQGIIDLKQAISSLKKVKKAYSDCMEKIKEQGK